MQSTLKITLTKDPEDRGEYDRKETGQRKWLSWS